MNYFNIQPIEITIYTPFNYKTITSIKWTAISVPRGSESSTFNCILVDTDGSDVYNWQVEIPKNIIDQWLDDSVIDDYICSMDARFIKV